MVSWQFPLFSGSPYGRRCVCRPDVWLSATFHGSGRRLGHGTAVQISNSHGTSRGHGRLATPCPVSRLSRIGPNLDFQFGTRCGGPTTQGSNDGGGRGRCHCLSLRSHPVLVRTPTGVETTNRCIVDRTQSRQFPHCYWCCWWAQSYYNGNHAAALDRIFRPFFYGRPLCFCFQCRLFHVGIFHHHRICRLGRGSNSSRHCPPATTTTTTTTTTSTATVHDSASRVSYCRGRSRRRRRRTASATSKHH